MTDTPVTVPGPRDVRGSLDGTANMDAGVVACPPHPQYGGTRSDPRLAAVADALRECEIACLRFDYGPWDGGPGEVTDAVAAIGWAGERFDSVCVFGYSFGGAVALCAAGAVTETGGDIRAVSTLAPVSTLGDEDAVAALSALADCGVPLQVVYGTRDSSADWEPVAERARARGCALVAFEADHFFLGKYEDVATTVADFLSAAV